MDLEDEQISSSNISSSSNEVDVAISSSPGTHKRRAGRKKFRETRHPVYRGVRERNGGKWVCEVREPHKKSRIWLGTYRTPEMAARAHDVASIALRGSNSAPLNFPDSAWALPLSASSSAKDIRAAATEAAQMLFMPKQQQQPIPPPPVTISSDSEEAPQRLFLDEEALFNMPGLIANMAEGMLLTPPAMQRGFDWDNDLDCQVDLSLWG